MREYKGQKYHLIDAPGVDKGRVFMFAIEGEKALQQLKSTNITDVQKEVQEIITKLKKSQS